MSTPELQKWLEAGITTLKAGNREDAQKLFMQVLAVNDRHETAWLWLSGAVSSKKERQICLENVLAINPHNQMARKGLQKLGINLDEPDERVDETDLFDEVTTDSTPPSFTKKTVRREYAPLSPAAAILYPERQVKEWEWEDPTTVHRKNEVGFVKDSHYDDVWEQNIDICAYCANPIAQDDTHCLQCKRKLISKHFRYPNPSTNLHVFWVLLAGLAQISLLQLIYHIIFTRSTLPAIWSGILIVIFGILAFGVYMRQSWAFITSLLLLISILVTAIVQYLLPPALTAQLLANLDPAVAKFLGGVVSGFGSFFKLFQLATAVLAIFYGFVRVAPDFDRVELRQTAVISKGLSDAGEFYLAGQRAARAGMWGTAVLHWQRAAAKQPTHLSYQRHLASAYAKLGFHKRALDILQTARQRVGHSETQQELDALIHNINKQMTTHTENQ
jgi:tetratricopeptide (TPR) repeat protein